jgi:hypothetical protein
LRLACFKKSFSQRHDGTTMRCDWLVLKKVSHNDTTALRCVELGLCKKKFLTTTIRCVALGLCKKKVSHNDTTALRHAALGLCKKKVSHNGATTQGKGFDIALLLPLAKRSAS